MRRLAPLALAAALALLAAAPAAGQTPSGDETSTTELNCDNAQPFASFIGRVTAIDREEVTFAVVSIRSGTLKSGPQLVYYPSQYNSRYLELGNEYRVGVLFDDTLTKWVSRVPNAEFPGCPSQSTTLVDGTLIDTGALAGVKEKGPRLLGGTVLVVLGVLALLIAAGRFFDRKSRYRPRKPRGRATAQ